MSLSSMYERQRQSNPTYRGQTLDADVLPLRIGRLLDHRGREFGHLDLRLLEGRLSRLLLRLLQASKLLEVCQIPADLTILASSDREGDGGSGRVLPQGRLGARVGAYGPLGAADLGVGGVVADGQNRGGRRHGL